MVLNTRKYALALCLLTSISMSFASQGSGKLSPKAIESAALDEEMKVLMDSLHDSERDIFEHGSQEAKDELTQRNNEWLARYAQIVKLRADFKAKDGNDERDLSEVIASMENSRVSRVRRQDWQKQNEIAMRSIRKRREGLLPRHVQAMNAKATIDVTIATPTAATAHVPVKAAPKVSLTEFRKQWQDEIAIRKLQRMARDAASASAAVANSKE